MLMSINVASFAIRFLFTSAFVWLSAPVIAGQFWHESQKLIPSDAVVGHHFGRSVAISANTAIVSSYRYTGSGPYGGSVGAAYVFRDNGRGNWSERDKLTQTDMPTGNGFGWSVATNGNAAIVGAPFDGVDFLDRTGAAYLFREDVAGNWSQLAKLKPRNEANVAYFGESVDMSGNLAIVGAPVGSTAFIFQDDGNGTWTEIARLTGESTASSAGFGDAVAIEGNTAIVGATGIGPGSAFIFRDNGLGTWIKVATLTAGDGPGGYFGQSVDIHGKTAIVGTYERGQRGAYIFQEDGDGVWRQVFSFVTPGGLYEDHDKLVAISGATALVGVPKSGIDLRNIGSVIVFQEFEGSWLQVDEFVPDPVQAGETSTYGNAVAIDRETILIGNSYSSLAALEAGTTDVFRLVPEPNTFVWMPTLTLMMGHFLRDRRFRRTTGT
jgi:hypothetical protein